MVTIKKADGSLQVFDPSKLYDSLINSEASEKTARSIVNHIEREVQDGMSTKQIYDHAFYLLHKQDHPGAIQYSLRRAIAELGPSGFPFEKYICEIFKQKGFNAITNQIYKGRCVEHEVDVVAWNDEKVIMCEAKFHNELGIKSDLKIALYIKARFDDLAQSEFLIGGKKRKLTEGWLITNTKFSSMAVQYGQCQGMHMVGWNYPSMGNLHQMIEDGDLHPITALTSLITFDKKRLLDQGIVLCKTLMEEGRLESLGFPQDKIEKIQEEITML
jgi:Holliday junction resolvase